MSAARSGRVPVHLVSSEYLYTLSFPISGSAIDLSEKNFLEILPYEATIVSLLAIFARGTHRGRRSINQRLESMLNADTVLVSSPSPCDTYLGMVSDMALLSWFSAYAEQTPAFRSHLSNSLYALTLPSLHMYSSVIAASSTAQVLDVMRLMSEQGVSSVAVIDEELGTLLSAVSVTDVGKV